MSRSPKNQSKTKAERRAEEQRKARVKKQRGASLAGQVQKTRTSKAYRRLKKEI